MGVSARLVTIEKIIRAGIDEKGAAEALTLMGLSNFPRKHWLELDFIARFYPKPPNTALPIASATFIFCGTPLTKALSVWM